MLRQSGREIKLSEMYTVYWEFVEKAREFVRTKGASLFDEGSESEALLLRWKQYGIVPEAAYTGLVDGATVFDQEPMMEEARAYLNTVKAGGHWEEAMVLAHVRSILDRHLGPPPAKVTADGREWTPREYLRDVLRVDPDDYVEFMSTLDAPFWTKAEFEVPDNYWHSAEYHNVPLDDWYAGLRPGGCVGLLGGDRRRHLGGGTSRESRMWRSCRRLTSPAAPSTSRPASFASPTRPPATIMACTWSPSNAWATTTGFFVRRPGARRAAGRAGLLLLPGRLHSVEDADVCGAQGCRARVAGAVRSRGREGEVGGAGVRPFGGSDPTRQSSCFRRHLRRDLYRRSHLDWED